MMLTHKVLFLFFVILLACSSTPSEAQTVYITRTGEKYHRGSCKYLKKSKIEINLAEAKRQGYTACSVCSPPTAVTEKVIPATKPAEEKPSPVKATPQKAAPKTAPPKKTTSRQCSGMTKSGLRCKRTTSSVSGKCWQHE